MWAIRRRLSIVGIIIAFLMVTVIIPYAYTHREIPSCTDGKQNQGEHGVDCGGPCAIFCKNEAKDLSVLWTKVFPIRAGDYDVVAYVENPNFEVGIQKFTYTTKLFDSNGEVIVSRESEGFARPSERFTLFTGGLLTGDKIPTNASIEINQNFDWVSTIKSPTLFSVTDKELTSADQKPKLTALIHNLTPDTYRNVDVSSIIYDSKNNPIGVSNTTVEKLSGGGEENLIFTWPSAFDYIAETGACETPIDVVLVIDRSGSMREEDKIGQAKSAAAEFIDRLAPQDQAAVVTFATEASNPPDQSLSDNKSRLKQAVGAASIHTNGLQFTNIADGLYRAVDELATQRHRADSRPIIVMLTDGIPTRPIDPNKKNDELYSSTAALNVAQAAKAQNISIYTIGLGSDLNIKLLEDIATKPEQFYQAASGAELSTVYKKISTAICKKNPSVIEIIPRINNVVPTPQTP